MVIIGVIAAITVPSLINKTNNQETVSKLKKVYSTLSQATNQIIAEEGPANNWANSENEVYNLYKKHLIKAKDCGSKRGCFLSTNYRNLNKTNDDSSSLWDTAGFYRKLILSDGTQLLFWNVSNLCNKNNDATKDGCAYIWADINGWKKPNTLGLDVFGFVVTKNGLFPVGCENGTCDRSTVGRECACKVLREGAMNY